MDGSILGSEESVSHGSLFIVHRTYTLLGVHQTLIVPPPGYRGRWPRAGSDADQLVPLARRQRLVRPDYPHLQRQDCKCISFGNGVLVFGAREITGGFSRE